uniref:Putative secreted protein n=1 Tax=Anopheles triannulatus TaxID=58253 RepID=A0A2M4B6Y3_9DIPT
MLLAQNIKTLGHAHLRKERVSALVVVLVSSSSSDDVLVLCVLVVAGRGFSAGIGRVVRLGFWRKVPEGRFSL